MYGFDSVATKALEAPPSNDQREYRQICCRNVFVFQPFASLPIFNPKCDEAADGRTEQR